MTLCFVAKHANISLRRSFSESLLFKKIIYEHFQRIQDNPHGNATETDEVQKAHMYTAYFQRQPSLHFDQGQYYAFSLE